MLIENEKHAKYHASGPADLKWPPRDANGALAGAVATIQVTRSTLDNEQMNISIPVFETDSREDLNLRIGMLMSITQDRIEDAATAWKEAAKKAVDEENQQLINKKKENLKGKKG